MRHVRFCLLFLTSTCANAQFTLVASNSSTLGTPGLGTLQTLPFSVRQANSGTAVRGILGNDYALPGYYVYKNRSWQAHARNNVTGNLGPNRVGAEQNHVFFGVSQFSQDFGGNDELAFVGSAGAPGGSGPKSYWRWNGSVNSEIARQGERSGPLSPNLGLDWRFGTTGSDNQDRELLMLANGSVVMDVMLISPANSLRHGVFLHRPGAGNVACLLNSDTSAALGPNMPGLPNEKFFIGQYDPGTVNNRVFISAGIDSGEGLWEVCGNNGANPPAPLAVSGYTGALGPNVGSLSARFTTIRSSFSSFANGDLAFAAGYRFDPNAQLSNGIFRHNAGANTLLLASGVDNAFGPNYQNAVFQSLDDSNQTRVRTAGNYLAIFGVARKPDNGLLNGLWRMQVGGAAQAVALLGESGSVSPGVGQSFSSIGPWTVFANGVIVALCTVNNGTSGLYRFSPGSAPELLLANGQTIQVANGASTIAMSVSAFSLYGTAPGQHARGLDDWAGANGNLLFSAFATPVGGSSTQVILSVSATNPDRYFANGFE